MGFSNKLKVVIIIFSPGIFSGIWKEWFQFFFFFFFWAASFAPSSPPHGPQNQIFTRLQINHSRSSVVLLTRCKYRTTIWLLWHLNRVWALIWSQSPDTTHTYTHTVLGSTSLGGCVCVRLCVCVCVKKIQPVISRLSPAAATLFGSYGNFDNRSFPLGCRRR